MVTKTTTRGVPISFTTTSSGPPGSSSTTYIPFTLTRTRESVSNKGWKQKIKLRQNAATPGTTTEESISLKKGYALRYVVEGANTLTGRPPFCDLVQTVEGQLAWPIAKPQIVIQDVSEAEAKALAQVYEAIRAQRSSVQLGVTMGEALESVDGIARVSNRLASMFGAHLRSQQRMLIRHIGNFVIGPTGSPVRDRSVVKRLRPVEKKISQEIRNAWLEFSLGLKPLVADVKDIAEAIARFNGKEYPHYKIKGFGQQRRVILATSDAEVLNNIQYIRHRKRVATSKVIYHCGLLPDPEIAEAGSAQRLHQILGLTNLADFVPTVWNLLPMSFIVDYVTNVSDIMSAWCTDTSRISYVCKSIVHETVEDCQMVVDGSKPYTPGKAESQVGDLGGYRYSTKKVIRTIPAGIEVPELRFNLPSADGLAIPNLLAIFTGGKSPRT